MSKDTFKLMKNRTILGKIYRELQNSTSPKPTKSIWSKSGKRQWMAFISKEVLEATRRCGFDLRLEYWDTPQLYDGNFWRPVDQQLFRPFLLSAAKLYTKDPYAVCQVDFFERLSKYLSEVTWTLEEMNASISGFCEEMAEC